MILPREMAERGRIMSTHFLCCLYSGMMNPHFGGNRRGLLAAASSNGEFKRKAQHKKQHAMKWDFSSFPKDHRDAFDVLIK